MSESVIDIVSQLVEKGLKMGADEVEIFAERSRNRTVNFKNRALKSAVSSILQGVGIRVLKNKSLGFTSMNSFDSKKIERGIEMALSIAKSTPPADYYSLPEPESIKSTSSFYDKNIDSLSIEDVIGFGNKILDTADNFDQRVSIDSGSFFTAKSVERALVSSKGIEAEYQKTLLQWVLFGMAVEDDDIGSYEYTYNSAINLSDLDIDDSIEFFAERAVANLGARKGKAFSGPAVLTPEAMRDLFKVLQQSARADQIQNGSSFLADRLGEQIAVVDITVIDDGTLANRPGSSSFDREGIPHQRHIIIEDGVFKGALFNAFSANRENLDSTGHAGGSYRQTPNIEVTNCDISAGDCNFEELIADIKMGILIPRISTFPDPVSGVFAGPIKGGQMILNGIVTDTLKEIQVTGNFFEVLQNVTMMTKERKTMSISSFMGPQESTIQLPYFKVEGLDFSV